MYNTKFLAMQFLKKHRVEILAWISFVYLVFPKFVSKIIAILLCPNNDLYNIRPINIIFYVFIGWAVLYYDRSNHTPKVTKKQNRT